MVNLLKRDSNTGVFLWNLLQFSVHLFHRTTLVAASEVFCKNFIDISYRSVLFRTLEDYVVAAYLFFEL